MNTGSTIFAQVMDFLPLHQFRKCVHTYHGDYKVKNFSCLDQFLCMAFAQLTYRESLRDIESCLRAIQPKLYHMGIRGRVSRSTLADANNTRDWRIFADFAQILIGTARTLYANDDFGVELAETVYALDSSTIDLCLSLFPWAKYQSRKGAVKLHTLLDLHGSIPSFLWITDGKVGDIRALDILIPEPGALYIMDRGYIDYARLYRWDQARAFFLVRARDNMKFRRLCSRPVDRSTGLRCDQTIVLTGQDSPRYYPRELRRVHYVDSQRLQSIVVITNNFQIPALTLAHLYKGRWRIELFFKWIKQHLRIRAFYGTSPNAVKTQIWIAISVYVLVAILKKDLRLEQSLYTILQVLSLSCFEKTPICQLLAEFQRPTADHENPNQQWLFAL